MNIRSLIYSAVFISFAFFSSETKAHICSQMLTQGRQEVRELLEVEPASIKKGVGIESVDRVLRQGWILKTLERLIGLKNFNEKVYLPALKAIDENFGEIYEKAQKASLYNLSEITDEQLALRLFIEALYITMNISINENNVSDHFESLKNLVPEEGVSAIAIANHPYGIIEGLIFSRTLLQQRPDVKFIANSMVSKLMPPTQSLTLPVDIVKGKKQRSQNSGTVDKAVDHVNSGGLIAIFPDPLVPIKKPFYSRKEARQEMDFKTGVSRIAIKTDAQIVMAKISGGTQNSFWFHLAGNVHLVFKLMRHLPEFVRNSGVKTFTITLAEGPSTTELVEESLVEGESLEHLTKGEARSLIKRMTDVLRDYYVSVFSDL